MPAAAALLRRPPRALRRRPPRRQLRAGQPQVADDVLVYEPARPQPLQRLIVERGSMGRVSQLALDRRGERVARLAQVLLGERHNLLDRSSLAGDRLAQQFALALFEQLLLSLPELLTRREESIDCLRVGEPHLVQRPRRDARLAELLDLGGRIAVPGLAERA